MSKGKVSLLGAGAAGCSLAFHLTQVGFDVLLYQDERFKNEIEALIRTGEMNALKSYEGFDANVHGTEKIKCVTTNIKEAVEFSDILIMSIPAFGQTTLFKAALPYITKNHIFMSQPGNFVIFDYLKTIRESGIKIESPIGFVGKTPLPCTFVECSSIPYACRIIKDNTVFIGGIKHHYFAGAYPHDHADAAFSRLEKIFDNGIGVKLQRVHILETPFLNANIVLHPTISIYNAGQIKPENKGFKFYKQGYSPLICRVFEAMDSEFRMIAKSVGFEPESFLTYFRSLYPGDDDKNANFETFFRNVKHLHFVDAPTDLKGRFISEDIQYIILPMLRYLAKKNNLDTPMLNSLLHSVEIMIERKLEPMRDLPEDEWKILTSK